MSPLNGLTLPVKVKDGDIIDASGKVIMRGEWDSLQTPLNPTGRQAILELTCVLLNESFIHDQAKIILLKLGY